MSLTIDHPEADRLARELAAATGESVTDTVLKALDERLRRTRGAAGRDDLADEIMAICRRCAALPTLDNRSPEEIIGYDEQGLTDHQAGAARPRQPAPRAE